MPRLIVFNHITLDGYFTRRNGDMSWAYTPKADKEWDEYVANNAKGGGVLVFGRVTYDMMAGYWPTPTWSSSAAEASSLSYRRSA
jgi:dihydrofolate reductase